MKYLVNRKTKEHVSYDSPLPVGTLWDIVEADSEGWIAHTGNVCPLPDGVKFEARRRDGQIAAVVNSWAQGHGNRTITHYRPILEPEKVQEPDYDPRSVSFNLLDRLKAAHEHAQTIPDLEAELREVLGSMGYDLVARSPFVEQNSDTKTPINFCQEDMSDWRNWREGDELEVVQQGAYTLTTGCIVTALAVKECGGIVIDKSGYKYRHSVFRFYRRPAKGEK